VTDRVLERRRATSLLALLGGGVATPSPGFVSKAKLGLGIDDHRYDAAQARAELATTEGSGPI
jgi:hypothetical protein